MSSEMSAPAGKATPRRVRKPPTQYHHGDLRAALIHATTLFVERDGLEALTLRKLAVHLRVSPPAVHHHFANKTELLVAATGAAFSSLDAELAAAEAGARSPAERLEALALAYVGFAVGRPGELRLVLGGHVTSLGLDRHPEVAGPGRASRRRLLAAVAETFGHPIDSAATSRRFAIVWAQMVGIARLVDERELGPSVGLPEAIALAREAVRSHLAGLR